MVRDRAIPFIAALITVVLVMSLGLTSMRIAERTQDEVITERSQEKTVTGALDAPPTFDPVPFVYVADEITLEELVRIAKKWDNVTIYLPTQLPDGMKLTAVWFKYGVYPIAIVVYDSHGEKDPRYSEISIQIVIGYPDFRTLYNESKLTEVNGWPAMIREKVPLRDPKAIARLGNYIAVVDVWIDGSWYSIAAAGLTVEEVMVIVQSMRPIEA